MTEGFEVDAISSGEELFSYLDKNNPALLLMDYMLNDLNAKEIVSELQKKEKMPPFIIMTGFGDEKLAVDLMKMGAIDYIKKDFNFYDILSETIARAINKLEIERKLAQSEEALIMSLRSYKELFDNSLDGIFISDLNGFIIEANKAFYNMTGLDKDKAGGISLSEIFQFPAEYSAYLKQQTKSGAVKNYHFTLTGKNNINIDCLLRSGLSHLTDRDSFMGIIRDISLEKLKQNAMTNLNSLIEEKLKKTRKQLERTVKQQNSDSEKNKLLIEKFNQLKIEFDNLKTENITNVKLSDKFVNIIANEFRNPLTSVLASTYLIEKFHQQRDDRNFSNQLMKTQDSIKVIASMMEKIVIYSKLMNENYELNIETMDLVQLINKVTADIQLTERESRKIDIIPDGDRRNINTDIRLLKYIIENLLENSIKFSPKKFPIEIKISYLQSSVSISVTDYGSGITSTDEELIYAAFYRGKKKTLPGAGMGLAIVKRCADLLGGELMLKSTKANGTTFTFVLKFADY
jgi:PAS domain S-box-containing protein